MLEGVVMYRQDWLEIDKSKFHYNLRKIKEYIGGEKGIIAVVKNNGYGHGGVELGKEAEKLGIKWLVVSSIEEGIKFRENGIRAKILVLDSIYSQQNLEKAVLNKLTVRISGRREIEKIERLGKKLKRKVEVHLEIDTGMGRTGAKEEEAYSILDRIRNIKEIQMSGMFTHYANAEKDTFFSDKQYEIFERIAKYARKDLGLKFEQHTENTAELLKMKKKREGMVRIGLGLYGLYPFKGAERILKVKPILSWKARITFLKEVGAGFSISYGMTFVTKQKSVIATIPVGYGDGYNRKLSNKGEVLVRGKRCPIVGMITMDMTMIDVTKVKGIKEGEEVVLIGRQREEEIKVDELANIQGTINYEVTSAISLRIPRIMING
ncbi:MAG: alanine racemase [Endomicrobium sp.]|jgi:alanine racemase|nr:alanine racemase [Endomicrobium sp.]